ncbi:hypothetical protein, partial [Klebsiella pneumoniae]|uniref:hypothetical protein n=1 Tax=Klebsiella pneumoniae TaxID=573 RepID=UPI001A8C2520
LKPSRTAPQTINVAQFTINNKHQIPVKRFPFILKFFWRKNDISRRGQRNSETAITMVLR